MRRFYFIKTPYLEDETTFNLTLKREYSRKRKI